MYLHNSDVLFEIRVVLDCVFFLFSKNTFPCSDLLLKLVSPFLCLYSSPLPSCCRVNDNMFSQWPSPFPHFHQFSLSMDSHFIIFHTPFSFWKSFIPLTCISSSPGTFSLCFMKLQVSVALFLFHKKVDLHALFSLPDHSNIRGKDSTVCHNYLCI
jgi:hypothetical protein